MKPGIQLRQSQQLSLTPQLQQAIKLLQLSQIELLVELRELAETNPLLELDAADPADDAADASDASGANAELPDEAAEDSEYWDENSPQVIEWAKTSNHLDDDDAADAQDAAPEGLRDRLQWQVNLSDFNAREASIAAAIVDALDDDGYLRDGLEPVLAALQALAPTVRKAEAEAVRVRLQRFEPAGVASLDLGDCLGAQIEQLDPATPGRELARAIVAGALDLLAHRDIAKLMQKFGASEADILTATALIRTLDPRPGMRFDPAPAEYVTPDAYAIKSGGRWRVSLSPDCQPRLAINQHYCGLIARAQRSDAAWLRGQLQEARWLIKSLESRADTLLKVAQAIVRSQSAFLEFGPQAMKPLVMREVAEQLELHESTISRVTTRKYLYTPRGTFEFKYFFSSGVATEDGGSASATAVQAMIKQLIDEEDARKPLSDQGLTAELNRRGIHVARRTVAKYREQLRIPSSSERVRAR